MKQLVIIDGNSLFFRAYFAMRPMVTSSGQHTQGIYAFINMLNKILEENQHDYIAIAFDMKHPTFRHEVYSEYKAGRKPTPLELLSELPILHDVLEAMNIKIFEMLGYEADDLIGTVSKKVSENGINVLVITGDKDELQLVDDNINVMINKKGVTDFELYDLNAMLERYGLTPSQFIDLKGLMGDKSDNIPGVPGVGEKKGIALLNEYGSIEEVLNNAQNIKGKLGENIRENIEQAKLSKWLATIKTDVPVDFSFEELAFREPDFEKLSALYKELEFKSFLKKLNKEKSSSKEDSAKTFDAAEEFNLDEFRILSLDDFLSKVSSGDEVVIHIDTDNNHLFMPKLSNVSLLSGSNKIFATASLTPIDCSLQLNKIFAKNLKLIGYDFKPAIFSMIRNGLEPLNLYHDIKIAEYLIDSNSSKYLLDSMLLKHCGISLEGDDFSKNEAFEAFGKKDEEVLRYLYYINLVSQAQKGILEENNLSKLFEECEMPLITTIAAMEAEGMSVNAATLEEIGEELTKKLASLESEIYEAAGETFNINSPKQLAHILFEVLELPYPKAKKKSGYSTAADILEKLEDDYEIVSNVLEYRKLSKLRSTYVEGLTALIGDDGKIRPHFNQTVASTGRLSCTEPNLQNIPIRDDYGRMIRKAFVVSDSSNIFVGADYSQIELRVLAALSKDENMLNAFNNGEDIHKATASRVFGIPMDEVTPLDRTKAKAVNFGVVYGMSSFGLSESLQISRQDGQKYINDYFEKHKAVRDYLDSLVEEGKTTGSVSTYYGRIRRISEFSSPKFMDRELAKRLAMNTPIQGTAADIIKLAMNKVYKELKDRGYKTKLILQIHDELIVEGPESELDDVKKLIEECMKTASDINVELASDIHFAKTWYELK